MPDTHHPTNNPLFQQPAKHGQRPHAAAHPQAGEPPTPAGIFGGGHTANDPAVELIRSKIDAIYAEEPAAEQEIAQAAQHSASGSKHQQYMNHLSSSGASLADIQTAWHAYYLGLPEHEKYEVWQEFYAANGTSNAAGGASAQAAGAATTTASPAVTRQHHQPHPHHQPAHNPTQAAQQPLPEYLRLPQVPQSIPEKPRTRPGSHHHTAKSRQHLHKAAAHIKKAAEPQNLSRMKNQVVQTAKEVGSPTGGGKLTKKHHLHSLAFGLASGLVVVFIFLFSFFNELIIAPFIQPSRQNNNTPVIVDVASAVVSGGPKVIIPKINVEIPVDYSQSTTDEKQIELALDKGVVHYPTTVHPGQAGNAAYFGHSSNNIFNPGKYKFAFVLLSKLVEGDTFYLTYENKTYAYKVFSKRVVKPSEVGVLAPIPDHPATATLITCDPPGTSINRLVVVGDQISPEPSGNQAPEEQPDTTTPLVASADRSGLPGNGPTLWARLWGSIF